MVIPSQDLPSQQAREGSSPASFEQQHEHTHTHRGFIQLVKVTSSVVLLMKRFRVSSVVALNLSATPLGKHGTSSPAVWEGAFWMVNCCRAGTTPAPAFARIRLSGGSQHIQQPSVPVGWLPASICKGRGQHKAAYSDPACFRNFTMAQNTLAAACKY